MSKNFYLNLIRYFRVLKSGLEARKSVIIQKNMPAGMKMLPV